MKISTEEKALWLEDWRKSGKKAWTYARENGLVPQTFVKWTQKETENKNGFIEVPLRMNPGQKQAQTIIVEKGEIKIHIPVTVWLEDTVVIMEKLKAAI